MAAGRALALSELVTPSAMSEVDEMIAKVPSDSAVPKALQL